MVSAFQEGILSFVLAPLLYTQITIMFLMDCLGQEQIGSCVEVSSAVSLKLKGSAYRDAYCRRAIRKDLARDSFGTNSNNGKELKQGR